MSQIDDSHPERRNLSATSLAFIVFYVGGGNFVDGDVTLAVINAHFSNTYLLAAIAWVILFWFAFRYHVTTKSVIRTIIVSSVGAAMNSRWNKLLKSLPGVDEKLDFLVKNQGWDKALTSYSFEVDRTDNRLWQVRIIRNGTNTFEHIPILSFTKIRLILLSSIEDSRLSGYLPPYLLFAMAVWLGVVNLTLNILLWACV